MNTTPGSRLPGALNDIFLLAMILAWAGFPQWRINNWAQAASPPPATQPVFALSAR